jgi:hypothetical protein
LSHRERKLVENSYQLRGRSGSENLPALRRYRIHCTSCGHQRQVRRRCLYPSEMSGLRRQWTGKYHAPIDRGLTARPVVLAKTYEPGASRSRRDVTIRAGRFNFPVRGTAAPRRRSRDSSSFPAHSSPGSRGRLDPIASSGLGAVESLVGCLDHFFRRPVSPPRSCHSDAGGY